MLGIAFGVGYARQRWPVALGLSVLIWIIATTGGRQVFVQEVLGDAFDSQAEHFLLCFHWLLSSTVEH